MFRSALKQIKTFLLKPFASKEKRNKTTTTTTSSTSTPILKNNDNNNNNLITTTSPTAKMSTTTATKTFAGKLFLITGGTKGIGRSLALRVASQGASVAVSYSSDVSAAESLVSSSPDPSNPILAIKADASSPADSARLVQETVAHFSKKGKSTIDVLIPNAGVMPMRDLSSATESDFDKVFSTNVKGPFFLAQAAVPHMSSDGSGRIVFISSGVAKFSLVMPAYVLYCASKGATEQFTRVLAKDPSVAGKGITVNAVAPGPTGTDLFMEGKPEGLINMIKSWSPFKRLGQPDEIAAVIDFIASPASSWISGQVIGANGGAFV